MKRVVLVLCAAGLAAGAAIAGTVEVTSSSSGLLQSDVYLSRAAQAFCPKGKVPVGGGVYPSLNVKGTIAYTGAEGRIGLQMSSPFTLKEGTSSFPVWAGVARQFRPFDDAWGLVTIAECVVPPPGGFHTVVEVSDIDKSFAKSVTAVCPKGEVIVGGGASIPGSFTQPWALKAPFALQASGPSAADGSSTGNEWTAIARAVPRFRGRSSLLWAVVAVAICAPPAKAPPGLEAVIARREAGNALQYLNVDAVCPEAKVLIGGGALTDEPSLAPGYQGVSGPVVLVVDTPKTAQVGERDRLGIATDLLEGYTGNWSLTEVAICAFP